MGKFLKQKICRLEHPFLPSFFPNLKPFHIAQVNSKWLTERLPEKLCGTSRWGKCSSNEEEGKEQKSSNLTTQGIERTVIKGRQQCLWCRWLSAGDCCWWTRSWQKNLLKPWIWKHCLLQQASGGWGCSQRRTYVLPLLLWFSLLSETGYGETLTFAPAHCGTPLLLNCHKADAKRARRKDGTPSHLRSNGRNRAAGALDSCAKYYLLPWEEWILQKKWSSWVGALSNRVQISLCQGWQKHVAKASTWWYKHWQNCF